MAKKTAAILGATGFTGVELLRLIAQHPEMEVVYASGDSQAGEKLSHLFARCVSKHGGPRVLAKGRVWC